MNQENQKVNQSTLKIILCFVFLGLIVFNINSTIFNLVFNKKTEPTLDSSLNPEDQPDAFNLKTGKMSFFVVNDNYSTYYMNNINKSFETNSDKMITTKYNVTKKISTEQEELQTYTFSVDSAFDLKCKVTYGYGYVMSLSYEKPSEVSIESDMKYINSVLEKLKSLGYKDTETPKIDNDDSVFFMGEWKLANEKNEILINRNHREVKIEIINIEAKKENIENKKKSANESIDSIKKSF